MKKNKMMRIASVLLVAVLLSTCVIAGTFAKYTESASGSDTATVAKWSVTYNGKAANEFTFDLFDTIKDSNGTDNESDVAANLIAPGTSGSFAIVLANGSEVTAKYGIDFTVTNTSNIPVKFSTDGGTTWGELSDITAGTDTTIAIGGQAKTVTVKWKWDYEITDGDAADTALGVAAVTSAPELKVEAKVTFTQVD